MAWERAGKQAGRHTSRQEGMQADRQTGRKEGSSRWEVAKVSIRHICI